MTQEIVIISANRSPKRLAALIAAVQAQYPGVPVTVQEPEIKGYSADVVCLDEFVTNKEPEAENRQPYVMYMDEVTTIGENLAMSPRRIPKPAPEYLPATLFPKKRNHPTSPRQRGGR